MAKKLTYFILAGLVLGIVAGWAINACDRRRHARGRRKAGRDRRLFLDRHHALPAAHQDDHRAAGLLDAGGRHRAYGRHGRARAGSAQRRSAGSSAPAWCR